MKHVAHTNDEIDEPWEFDQIIDEANAENSNDDVHEALCVFGSIKFITEESSPQSRKRLFFLHLNTTYTHTFIHSSWTLGVHAAVHHGMAGMRFKLVTVMKVGENCFNIRHQTFVRIVLNNLYGEILEADDAIHITENSTDDL